MYQTQRFSQCHAMHNYFVPPALLVRQNGNKSWKNFLKYSFLLGDMEFTVVSLVTDRSTALYSNEICNPIFWVGTKQSLFYELTTVLNMAYHCPGRRSWQNSETVGWKKLPLCHGFEMLRHPIPFTSNVVLLKAVTLLMWKTFHSQSAHMKFL